MFEILFLVSVILFSVPAQAKRVNYPKKFFPSTHDSVRLENEAGDAMGIPRIANESDLSDLVEAGALVPLGGLLVCPKLPVNRRYALPETVLYLRRLDDLFSAQFGRHLVVTSAVRPATVQKKLRRRNRNAAPADGDRASSHERGTTIDISRHLTRSEYCWIVLRLMVDKALGRVMVIEERACIHIFVTGKSCVELNCLDSLL
jgi:hypothetical protein